MSDATAADPRAAAVLAFWFAAGNAVHWFDGDGAFDERVRTLFAAAAEAAAAGRFDGWAARPADWLALLILLDQFPRNIHRGDPRAWAQDVGAQRIALSGIAEGHDGRLPTLWRVFAYLPLEHAEDIALQRRSVALFETLCVQAPPELRDRCADFLDYARRHCETIARFGRFPHRNAVLGRASTAEERAWLEQPGAGF